jgi:hypothetical protein
MADSAPTPKPDEKPLDYIMRVVAYLNEPDRRRLGDGTRRHMQNAVNKIRKVI